MFSSMVKRMEVVSPRSFELLCPVASAPPSKNATHLLYNLLPPGSPEMSRNFEKWVGFFSPYKMDPEAILLVLTTWSSHQRSWRSFANSTNHVSNTFANTSEC